MNERSPFEAHSQLDARLDDGVDWIAVLLELTPLLSILVIAVFWIDESRAAFWPVLIPLMASGLGWCKIDRFGTGCLLGIVRAVALCVFGAIADVALFVAFGCAWEGAASNDCDTTVPGIWFLASALTLALVSFLVPIVSAILVALASRDRLRLGDG